MEEYNKLFVGGDLSGIQKYLYNISSHKAAVSLTGRSAKLSNYMEDCCEKIRSSAEKAGANDTKKIYCSGGKFYVIVDIGENRQSIITELDSCIRIIKEALWKEQLGQLAINISYVPFSENSDGTVNVDGRPCCNCGELWRIVNAKFAAQKNQKFKDYLISHYTEFFNPIHVGGKSKVCAITGIESKECVPLYEKKPIDGKENFYVLPIVKEQINKGMDICDQYDFRDFDKYADGTEMGVLRMDVDGLGKRLIKGFDSIDKYKEYSDSLTDFFEKDIREFQKKEKYKDYLNIVYAGGDDLFIVGRWDKVIDFAELIHKETELAPFNQSAGNDDKIHISGGVVIVKPTFPIAKAAELAGDAEDNSKQYKDISEGKEYVKNAFHMFGKTISWERPIQITTENFNKLPQHKKESKTEFEYVKYYKDKFISLTNSDGLSKSILHQIMLYSSIADKNKILKDGEPKNYSYIWHLSYYLTRFAKRSQGSMPIREFCYNLRDNELKNERKLELIALSARWAELILKDELYDN